jgi:hypothetical protein
MLRGSAGMASALSPALDFYQMEQIAPRIGVTDVPCPLCSAQHSPRGARRRVLRVWRTDQHFAGFACARCGERGWSRNGHERAARPSPDRLSEIRRDAAERELAEQATRQRTVLFLWSRRLPVEGTAAEIYLRQARHYRGTIPQTLGYLPARGEHGHAMIAAFGLAVEAESGVLAISDDAVAGVHLTKLNADGTGKAIADPNKIMIGKSAGVPICLAPPNDLLGMAVTEGIEDALSVYQVTGLGLWAAGSAGRMPALADRVPRFIECVSIFAHPDPAGQAGAIGLADRLKPRGIETILQGLSS